MKQVEKILLKNNLEIRKKKPSLKCFICLYQLVCLSSIPLDRILY